MSPTKLPETVNLSAVFADSKLNTLRIELSYGLRAPIVDGQVTLLGVWRADLYEIDTTPRYTTDRYGRPRRKMPKPVFLGTFVTTNTEDESPADLLRQLADIYGAGELPIRP